MNLPVRLISVLAIVPAVMACSTGASDREGAAADDLAWGEPASAPEFQAVGIIDDFSGYCTATLIAPNVVLTARHCLNSGCSESFRHGRPFMTKDGAAKIVEQRILPYEGTQSSGSDCRGSDLAVGILDRPLTGVPTLKTAQLAPEDIGTTMTMVGYGDNEAGGYGSRRKGETVLRALDGKFWEQTYGTREALQTYLVSRVGEAKANAIRGEVDFHWGQTLVGAHEAYVWTADKAQTRRGDSGGPLLKRVNGEWRVTAVVSGGWSYLDMKANLGAVFAKINAESQAMIDAAVAHAASLLPAQPSTPSTPATGVECGDKVCAQGQVCCNPFDGICTPPGGFCAL